MYLAFLFFACLFVVVVVVFFFGGGGGWEGIIYFLKAQLEGP